MRGLTSATMARNPATDQLLKGKAEASNEDSDGPKWIFPDSNSVSAVRLWKLTSLWIVLVLHLSLLPVVQAADTTADGQSFSLLWISFLGAIFLLFCLDRCLLWTNSYSTIHGFLSAIIGFCHFLSRRMNNNHLQNSVWILIGMVFKAVGLPVQVMIRSNFGYSSATYWILVWHFICGVYIAARRSLIAFETDSASTILIKLAEQFLIVLANRRFGLRWMGVKVVFGQLDRGLTILIIKLAKQFLIVLANRQFGMRWMGVTAVFDQFELFLRISNLGFLLEQILLVGPFHVWLRLGRFS